MWLKCRIIWLTWSVDPVLIHFLATNPVDWVTDVLMNNGQCQNFIDEDIKVLAWIIVNPNKISAVSKIKEIVYY